MSTMASQITGVLVVYSTVCSDAEQRKYQSSASLAFVRGIRWWPVISPHKGPVTRKMFPFDDVIMGDRSACAVSVCLARSWSSFFERSAETRRGTVGYCQEKLNDPDLLSAWKAILPLVPCCRCWLREREALWLLCSKPIGEGMWYCPCGLELAVLSHNRTTAGSIVSSPEGSAYEWN